MDILDAEDVQSSDKLINEFSKNQNKKETVDEDQISILKKSTENVEEIAQNVTNNQKILAPKISVIETIQN